MNRPNVMTIESVVCCLLSDPTLGECFWKTG